MKKGNMQRWRDELAKTPPEYLSMMTYFGEQVCAIGVALQCMGLGKGTPNILIEVSNWTELPYEIVERISYPGYDTQFAVSIATIEMLSPTDRKAIMLAMLDSVIETGRPNWVGVYDKLGLPRPIPSERGQEISPG